MANTYTEKLKLRKPAEGDGNWADEMNSNAQIMEVVQAAILKDNYVVSGLVTSTAAGLVVDYTAGVVVINGTQFSVASGSKTAADNTDGTAAPNFLYVDSSGVMQISTTPPTGEYAPLAVVDTLSAAITRIGDLRHQKTPKAPLSGATFTGLVNLAAGADIASAATINLTEATGNCPRITGTTPTSEVIMNLGQPMFVVADGEWPLTYNATTNNINTGGANYTCTPGDVILYYKDLSGVVHGCIQQLNGTPEKGTWTPAVSFSTSNGDLAHTLQVGTYEKLPGICFCQMLVDFGETTASGGLSIGGLPFPARSVTNTKNYFHLSADSMTGTVGSVLGTIQPSATSFTVNMQDTGNLTGMTQVNTGSASRLAGNFFYFT